MGSDEVQLVVDVLRKSAHAWTKNRFGRDQLVHAVVDRSMLTARFPQVKPWTWSGMVSAVMSGVCCHICCDHVLQAADLLVNELFMILH